MLALLEPQGQLDEVLLAAPDPERLARLPMPTLRSRLVIPASDPAALAQAIEHLLGASQWPRSERGSFLAPPSGEAPERGAAR